MNNYTQLEKIFHKFALSPQIIREVAFDIESSLLELNNFNDNNIFITGLARSGTTILLNAIYKSNLFASLTYADMPFILAPNLWSKISYKKGNNDYKERAHRDGIKFSLESPEAFEEVFWKTFDENDHETIDKFRIFINNINFKYNKNRYLSKNNQNIKRVSLISESFSESKILIPFREPIQHAYSLLYQHKKFIDYSKKDKFIAKYMKLIGHTEFGPNYYPMNKKYLYFLNDLDINHWIEQWNYVYSNLLELVIRHENVKLISYEKICNSKEYWLQILDYLGINDIYEFEFKESKKVISLEFNNELLKKASSVYSKLHEVSSFN